jgi:hypothetical protein
MLMLVSLDIQCLAQLMAVMTKPTRMHDTPDSGGTWGRQANVVGPRGSI